MAINDYSGRDMFMRGIWGDPSPAVFVDRAENNEIAQALISRPLNCLTMVYEPLSCQIVICTLVSKPRSSRVYLAVWDPDDYYALHHDDSQSTFVDEACNAFIPRIEAYRGRPYIIFMCREYAQYTPMDTYASMTAYASMDVQLNNVLYDTMIERADEIAYVVPKYSDLVRPICVLEGHAGHNETSLITIPCFKCTNYFQKVFYLTSREYDDCKGGGMRYRVTLCLSDDDYLQPITRLTVNADVPMDAYRSEINAIIKQNPSRRMRIICETYVDGQEWRITSKPQGPLLEIFANYLTPEQLALYMAGEPSDAPTYDADDAASDDDYGVKKYDPDEVELPPLEDV